MLCIVKRYARIVAMERFWAKVDKNGSIPEHVPDLGPCWLWVGYRKSNYGGFWYEGKSVYAHRFAYGLCIGVIPIGFEVCHHCDVTICVRPTHFFLGVQSDNARDMWKKRRGSKPPTHFGESHPMVSLPDQGVEDLRSLHLSGEYSQRQLATMFEVSQSTVWRLIHHIVRV